MIILNPVFWEGFILGVAGSLLVVVLFAVFEFRSPITWR